MKKKVLVIDDDEGILEAIGYVLEDGGFEVKKISSGKEVKNIIRTFGPDVILLDMLLSGTDGREICRQIKNDSKTKNIPVIMTSAHPSAQESVASFGPNDFLAKPFEIETLLNKINKLL